MNELPRLQALIFRALNKAEEDETITREDYEWANKMLFLLFKKEDTND